MTGCAKAGSHPFHLFICNFLSCPAEVIIQKSLGDAQDDRATASPVLTKREREVLQLLAEGKTIKEIAFKLNVSIKTIYTHREKVMQKLKIDNVAGVIKYAMQTGLISIHE